MLLECNGARCDSMMSLSVVRRDERSIAEAVGEEVAMERVVGTTARGLRTPIISQGDDLAGIVVDTVLQAAEVEGYAIEDRDIVAVTESVVGRAEGNYASVAAIAADVRRKYGEAEVGVIFPILSRNRFGICLRGIAQGAKKIVVMLSYPADEVGNELADLDVLDAHGVNPRVDVLTEERYREMFRERKHVFTGVDYVDYYKSIAAECGAECTVVFANNPETILEYTDHVLACDIHTRERTKRILREKGAAVVYGLDDLLQESVEGSGFNEEYGLLGSNKATEDRVKLFPRSGQTLVETVQQRILERTGKCVEVMVYGDGAFKDPVGKVWELADPVVSPAFTPGLDGTPNEVKLKYLADNQFAQLRGAELKEAIERHIKGKGGDLTGSMESQGTTPRRLTDLIGSLCDLVSGSGDKGTPVVYIKGYFDNYADRG